MSRKGRRLAVALSPRRPRWGSLVLATVVVVAYAAFLLGFFHFAGEEYAPHRAVLVTAVIGVFLLACIVMWTREFIRWLLAGRTRVEVSREPVSPGQDLEYYILFERDYSSLRQFEATLFCRRQVLRHSVEELVALPLAAPEIDPQGRKAVVQGTVKVPDAPPTAQVSHELRVEWLIRIRAVFGRNAPFVEEFPVQVR